jgi:AraC-like DNA-binding protein
MKMEEAERLVARRTASLLEFQHREHQRIQELDQTKLRHLTQLAQEFGAPLTVMLQVLEQGQPGQPLDAKARDTLGRNAQSLRALVDQSLSLRRLELEDRALEWQEIEIVAFVRGVMQMFSAAGREHRVEIDFQPLPPARVIWTDPAKLEKVLFNVLGRVFAAVAPGVGISVGLQLDDGQARLRLDFKSAGAPGAEASGGGDISWLLSGEILRLLGGQLHWNKPENSETEPLHQVVWLEFPVTRPEPAAVAGPAAAATIPAPATSAERELPVALLVEPNADLRLFIRQGLGSEYEVLETVGAAQGLAVAREDVPDLIVIGGEGSPNDGVELCRKLKREEMTSHIPVILLAGDDSDASRLLALQAGANEFLAKPFRLPLLQACADNLLANRRKLHEHFQHLASVQPRELAANQVDAEFLRKVVVIVEKNLTDYEFDVEQLARQMAVSRRQLFRKFKAVAGCTPNVFIRDLRLKRAAQLLRESQLTVSEIIYAVGFSDPKYFRTIFRERFGVLPGEYSKPTKADA